MIEKPSTDEIRARLVQWLACNQWTLTRLSRAMRGVQIYDIASPKLLETFVVARGDISRPYAVGILQFIETYPSPGSFNDFEAAIAAMANRSAKTKQEMMTERLDKLERDRAEYQARCLADEHKPKVREFGVLFGLEKDVVAALSGAGL